MHQGADIMLLRNARGMLIITVVLGGANTAPAQDFPAKPLRLLTLEAGGNSDFVSRILAQGLAGRLGQPVIVDNRPGATLAAENVARAAPDGHTLLVIGNLMWIAPLFQSASYDAVRDFAPVSSTHRSPNILVVHPSLPVKSVRDLIALAKQRPGMLNYASGGIGGGPYLAAELFKEMARVNIVNVPYKGTSQAINDLIGGHVQVMFAAAVALHHVKSGRLRGLAVTSAQASPLFPGLPSVAESGVPGYEAITLFGVFAPARTPLPVVQRLSQEVAMVIGAADVKERLLNTGVEAMTSTPDQFATAINAEIARVRKLIRQDVIRTP